MELTFMNLEENQWLLFWFLVMITPQISLWQICWNCQEKNIVLRILKPPFCKPILKKKKTNPKPNITI